MMMTYYYKLEGKTKNNGYLALYLTLYLSINNVSQCIRFQTTSVKSDEPLQAPFKLRNSKWCSVSSLTIIEYSSD